MASIMKFNFGAGEGMLFIINVCYLSTMITMTQDGKGVMQIDQLV